MRRLRALPAAAFLSGSHPIASAPRSSRHRACRSPGLSDAATERGQFSRPSGARAIRRRGSPARSRSSRPRVATPRSTPRSRSRTRERRRPARAVPSTPGRRNRISVFIGHLQVGRVMRIQCSGIPARAGRTSAARPAPGPAPIYREYPDPFCQPALQRRVVGWAGSS